MLGISDGDPANFTKKLEEILPIIKDVSEKLKDPVTVYTFLVYNSWSSPFSRCDKC